jgi:CHAT domain-containing protein
MIAYFRFGSNATWSKPGACSCRFALSLILSILGMLFTSVHSDSRVFARTRGGEAQGEKEARQLEPGKPIERELSGGQSHLYKITAGAGKYLNILVEQRGIDVTLALLGPDGKQVLAVDSPNGAQGPEPVLWICETGGDYRLEVRSIEKAAPAGRYEARIVDLRTADDRDRSLAEAFKLFYESIGLRNMKMHVKAILLADRALQIRENILGSEHPDVAATLDLLASLYRNIRDYAKAEALYERELVIQEKVLGNEHPNLASLLNELAAVSYNKGDYAKVEPLYLRALAISEKSLEPGHPVTLAVLNSLGTMYLNNSDYDKAEAMSLRTLAIAEKAQGAEGLQVANSLNSLASLYFKKGDYAKVEPLFKRSLAIVEKALGPEHPQVAIFLNNSAGFYQVIGDYDRAENLFLRAQAILEKALDPGHPQIAALLHNLAALYRVKGDYAKAEPLFQRALTIMEKALGNEHPTIVNTLNNLAMIYEGQSDYAKAEPLLRRALAILEKTLGPDHASAANTLGILAELYRLEGKFTEAEPLYKRSLAIAEKTLGPEHPFVAKLLDELVIMNRARGGEMTEAITLQSRASEISESNLNRNLLVGSERQKLAYLATFYRQSQGILSLHLNSAPNDPAARDLAVAAILRRKGRALDAMTDNVAALRRRVTPQGQTLLDQLIETRSQLAQLALRGPANVPPAAHQTLIKNLEEQAERIEGEISALSAEFREATQPVTIAAVRAAMPEKSALVEFFCYRPLNPKVKQVEQLSASRYVAYVIRPDGEVRWIELGEAAAIDEAVDALRHALRDPRRRDVKLLARKLDQLVMDPLFPLLGESRRIFLSPDGELNLVPFAALVDKDGHYLINHYEFSYLTSGRDLLRSQVKQRGQQSSMIVANPDFGAAASNVAAKARGLRLKNQPAVALSSEDNSILSNAFFAPLPGTAGEAKAMKRLLPNATVLTGSQATESALKRVSAPEILHIATHGFFLEDKFADDIEIEQRRKLLQQPGDLLSPALNMENPLLRSGLGLAGANLHKNGDDDGVLTAMEVAGMNLWGSKLVVLSACDTGVGEIRNGDGVYGLRRALALAGSETQVMSLWPVSDKATRDLIIEYYKKLLSGKGRSEALREAQLYMLTGSESAPDGGRQTKNRESARRKDAGRKTRYTHPFYWACFIQSGEWRSIELQELPSQR